MKKIIKTDHAPSAIGPYSQAIEAGGFVFTAGQIPIDVKTGTVVEADIANQTKQVLENLKAIIAAANVDFSSVVKTTVYLTKPEDFTSMNEVYAKYFTDKPPARATVFVNALPMGVLVEIDAIAKI